MDNQWKITYRIDRRDFWLDLYFTHFYHPWGRWMIGLLVGFLVYIFAHRFVVTHSPASASWALLTALPRLSLVYISLSLLNKMPTATRTRTCSAVIDALNLRCIEPEKVYRFPWKKVMAIRQTLEYVLFFTWNGGIFTVPKRAFDDPDEAQRFYETALYYERAAKSGQPASIPQDGEVWPPPPRIGA